MTKIEYSNAYTEVLEILKYVKKEDYEKIPKEIINIFKKQSNKNYNFKFDITKKINDQEILYKTKIILAILFRDYWATDRQKEIILSKEKFDRSLIENEKREKYNPDKLFIDKTNNNKK